MNKKQFDLISAALIRSPQQRDAVSLVVIDGKTAYEAEKAAYGAETNTVSRDAKRIIKRYEECKAIMALEMQSNNPTTKKINK